MCSPCGHICCSCCHHARGGRDATKSDEVLCPPPPTSPRPHSRPGCAGVWLRGCKVALSSSNATRLFNHGECICPESRLRLDFLGERRASATSSPGQQQAACGFGALWCNRPLSGRHALQTENKKCKGTRLPYDRLEYLLVTYGPSCDTTSCVSVSL